MAHLDYSQDFEDGRVAALVSTSMSVARDWLNARQARWARHARQREDREAFRTLLGKEHWVFADMGINRADVEALAREPLHVNAARELETLRMKATMGR